MNLTILRTFALLALAACSVSPGPLQTCSPGVQTACACPGGAAGAQRCSSDGASYGACDCPDASPVDAAKADAAPEVATPDVQAVDTPDAGSSDAPDAATAVDVVDVVDVPADRPDVVDAPRVTCPAGQTACEDSCINLNTTSDHCGTCDTACAAFPHTVPQCLSGHCSATCASGYAECNVRAEDGCEALLSSDSRNCGRCGNACPGGRPCVSGRCAT